MKKKILLLITLLLIVSTATVFGSNTKPNSCTPIATSGAKTSAGKYYWTGGVWREGFLNKTACGRAVSYAKYNDGSPWDIDQIRATVVLTVGSNTYSAVGDYFSYNTDYVQRVTKKNALGSVSCCTEHEWREQGYQTVIKERNYS